MVQPFHANLLVQKNRKQGFNRHLHMCVQSIAPTTPRWEQPKRPLTPPSQQHLFPKPAHRLPPAPQGAEEAP